MIFWNTGKAGFVGGLKHAIKGAYSYLRSSTSVGPLPPGIEWVEDFDGILVNQVFNGLLDNTQRFDGILKSEAIFNGVVQLDLFRTTLLVDQVFNGILVDQRFDGVIDT